MPIFVGLVKMTEQGASKRRDYGQDRSGGATNLGSESPPHKPAGDDEDPRLQPRRWRRLDRLAPLWQGVRLAKQYAEHG
jgi:hypothetical protein